MGDGKGDAFSPARGWDWWIGETPAAPAQLEAPFAAALAERHFREGRFLAVMGFVLGLTSLVIDALIVPEKVWQIAAWRLIPTVPLQLLAFALPRKHLLWQKFLIGASLCVFATSLIFTSQIAQGGLAIAMTLSPIVILGIAVPLLPYSRLELALFLVGYVFPVMLAMLHVGLEADLVKTLLIMLAIVAMGATAIGLRLRALEEQGALATLLAETRARELETSNERLRQLSMQDPLTDLANRRWVESAFTRDYAKSAEEVPGYACVFLLDIDHFKAFNDRWGHGAGDDCLLAVARVLQHAASTHGGIAARFGGEEFVLLLRIEDLAMATTIAEQIRVAVERIEIACGHPGQSATCTISIGIAIHEDQSPPALSDLLKQADEALYRAKDEGRNRFSFATG